MAGTTAPQTASPQRADPQRAAAHRSPERSHAPRSSVARLQRTAGNQSLLRLLQSRAVQPRLTVGPADDEYEREADRVADEIVRMPDPGPLTAQRVSPRLQRMCPECEEEKKQEEESAGAGVQRAPAIVQRLCAECEEEDAPRTPVQTVQRMCPASEEEEAQRTPDPIQRMCPECEEEAHRQPDQTAIQRALIPLEEDDEEEEEEGRTGAGGSIVQTKRAASDSPEPSADLDAYVRNSRDGGQPLPEATRASFESRFGQDFGGVRVHTGTRAAEAAAEINALAFTTGPNIYFAAGRFNPGTPDGDRLLAHELTHTIQQTGGRPLERAVTSSHSPPTAAEPPTDSSRGGDVTRRAGLVARADDDDERENRVAEDLVRMPDRDSPSAPPPPAPPLIQRRCPECEEEAEDLTLQRQLPIGVGPAIVPPLAGAAIRLARETPVELRGHTTFDPPFLVATYIQFLGPNGEAVPVRVKFGDLAEGRAQARWHAGTGTYELLPVLLPMQHPGIKVDGSRDTLVLYVRSLAADSSILGHMGFTPGLTAARLPRLLGAGAAGLLLTDENMFRAILGEDYDRGELLVVNYENLIAGGFLTLSFGGLLTIAGGQTIAAGFSIVDRAHAWKGSLTPHVKGLEDKELEVTRSAKAELSAEGDGLTVTSEWSHEDIVNAKLTASYVNGVLQIRGDATIETDRLKGEATLLVTDEDTARAAAEARLPVPLIVPPGTPSRAKGLAITGWGTVKATLIKDKENKDLLTGDAEFVIEPEGYVTVSGTFRVPKRFTLIEAKPSPWKEHYRTPEFRAWFSPVWAPGGVRVKASGGLSSRYTLGPVSLYQIEAGGLYSTNPKIPNELSVSARLNASAEAQGRVSIEGDVAARFGTRFDYVGVDAASAGLKLDATGTLKGYVDVAPTIGMREELAEGRMPKIFIKGTVDVGGELDIVFSGQFHIQVLAAKWEKTIEFGKRTIGGFNISIELDHTFGEDAAPNIKVKTGNFERGRFVKAILLEKKAKDTDELAGGYSEKGKELADITATETPITDAPPPEPETIEDDFTMQGVRHLLILELGAPGEPAELFMATNPERLIQKIEVTKNVLSVTYPILDADERVEMDRRLRDLDKIKKAAERVLNAAHRLGVDPTSRGAKTRVPGFVELGDLISEYGDRYDVTDIKPEPAGTEPSPGTRQNPFELVWPKPPTKDYPTIYLGGRIDKLKPQSVLKGLYTKGQNDETGNPVKAYTPHRGGTLPGGETIGISPAYRMHVGRIIGPLSEETTPGGGKLNRIMNRYGYYATQEGTEADHVQEVQFGGPDDVANMWMLDESINGAAGPKLAGASATYPKTGRAVKLSELKTRTKSYFFKITRFEF